MRAWFRVGIACLAGVTASGCATTAAQRGSDNYLLAVSKGEPHLYKVDLDTGEVVLKVATAPKAHEVTISPDGRRAYLPIYGDGAVGRPGTDGSTIEVYETSTLRRLETIELGKGVRPHTLLIDRQGLLWVTAEMTNTVIVVDPVTRREVARIDTGQPETHGMVFSPDQRWAFTSNVGAGSVSVIDMRKRRLATVIPIAKRVQRISISQDGRYVFTHDTESPRVAVIDVRTHKLVRWLSVPHRPYVSAAMPDGVSLLVGSPFERSLHTVDISGKLPAKRVEVDCDPTNIEVSSAPRKAYVSCPRNGVLAVLDLRTMTVERLVQIERGLEGIAPAIR